ncbi:MAG TPA: hypothetical protein VM493_07935, partial [Vicinamibacterales bacterium]|nr:hypothetical protein [Vicinamibacterales bacterium]
MSDERLEDGPSPTAPAKGVATGDSPRILSSVIGWSNWRGGCEFYEDTERNGENYARWLPRARPGDQPMGRLLTDELNDPEGA